MSEEQMAPETPEIAPEVIPETPAETPQQSLSERLLTPPEKQDPAENPGQKPSLDPWDGEGWKDLVPAKFKTPEGEVDLKNLAKSYLHAEKRIGTGDVPPKDESGYKLEYNLPEGIGIDPERETGFLKGCHAKGMTNAQVQFVMDSFGTLAKEGQALQAAQKVDAETVLKGEWGDEFEKQMILAQKAFHLVADEQDKANIDQIGTNPAVLRLLAKLGGNLKEDPGLPADVVGMQQEDVLVLQKSEAYWNAKHPEHEKVKAQVTRYYQHKR